MMNNLIDCRESLSPAWAVEVFGVTGSLGLVFGPAQGISVTVLLAGAVLALAVILGMVWQSRVRTARHWNAALEAYADREIARARSRKVNQRRDVQVRPTGAPELTR